MPETPGSDVDLNILARRGDPDWSFERLLRFAASGFGMAITVVVDGTLISGLLGTESEWAESLDAGPARVMDDKERHYGAAPEDVDALFEQVRTHGFAATAEEQEPSPTACARRCRRSPAARRTGHRRAHHLPVWRPLEVGRIRVLVAHVGAWWAGGLMPAPDEAEA